MIGRTVAFLALVGCSESEFAAQRDVAGGPPADETGFKERVALRLDVIPSRLRESDATDAAYRALPQTLEIEDLLAQDLDLGTIQLRRPQLQTGTVEAFRVNPTIDASLPGETVPVDGRVRIHAPGTVQSYNVGAVAGAFEAWVVPDTAYRLEIVPDDPMLPVWTGDLVVGEVAVDEALDLGTGVPIYGHVTSAGGPVAGARVHAVDADGVRTASAIADEGGFYQLRVSPGTWTVVSEGRALGLDPVLRTAPVEVGDLGANVDVAYPTPLATALVEGQVVDLSGEGVDGAIVRFTATALTGYDDLDAGFSIDLEVQDNTSFLGRVVPGVYTVEVLPPTIEDGPDLTPLRVTDVTVAGDATLGTFELDPVVPVGGEVRDPEGKVVSGAQITCAEVGFDGRYWTVFTDDRGTWAADLPAVDLACEVVPPGDRTELATLHTSFDPAEQRDRDFKLARGQRLTGRVQSDDGPEEYAVVEVLDQSGRQLGLAFTDADGGFAVHVDVGGADVTIPSR